METTMIVHNQEHLDGVKAFAEKTGRTTQLEKQFAHLERLAKNGPGQSKEVERRILLHPDFAPQSFYWEIQVKKNGDDWQRWMNGGLIFHGAHDNGGDGGAPTYSVCLTAQDGWSIHT